MESHLVHACNLVTPSVFSSSLPFNIKAISQGPNTRTIYDKWLPVTLLHAFQHNLEQSLLLLWHVLFGQFHWGLIFVFLQTACNRRSLVYVIIKACHWCTVWLTVFYWFARAELATVLHYPIVYGETLPKV